LFPTRKIQTAIFGANGGSTGVDNDMAERSFENVSACILGCNMFGPVRGDWPTTAEKAGGVVPRPMIKMCSS
jgi:hypothetical protein